MSSQALKSVQHIADVVTRVTKILSGKKINVVQAGMKVGVEYNAMTGAPETVYLPSIAENPSEELLTAIQGFLDKEVSTLIYSDHDVRQKVLNSTIKEFKKGMSKSLQEIIEDSRTERAMRKDFKGSATNFDKNHDFAVNNILKQELEKVKGDPNKTSALLALPAIRAAAGDIAYEEFMDGKWESLGKLGGAILHYANDLRDVSSTQESFDITRKIIKMMEGKDDDENEDNGEGDGDGDSEGEGQGQGKGQGTQGDGDDGKEGAGKGGAPQNGDLDEDNKSKQKTKQGAPSGSSGTQQGLTEFDDLDKAFEENTLDKKLEENIKKMALKDAINSPYVPFSRELDYVGPFPNPQDAIKNYAGSTNSQKIAKMAHDNAHVIQQQIQKLFIAKSMTRFEPGHKRGRINSSALPRLCLGKQSDDRIFRKKIETDSRNIAVSLLVDMSGSMHGCGKIDNACVATLMFSSVLTTLGIAHEVSFFTTYSGGRMGSLLPDSDKVNRMIQKVREEEHGNGVSYARVAPIVNFIVKSFDKRQTEDDKKLMASVPYCYGGMMCNNVDGESVQVAGQRLLARKERRKVMIVMSDGQPAADGDGRKQQQNLRNVIKNLSDSGVEMLGLGLMDDAVKRYYPKSEVVLKSEEIPLKILELTRQMVVGA
jgi:cobaltochelatase CobT